MTTKHTIRTNIGDKDYDADFDIKHEDQPNIDELITWLQEMKGKGATHIDFGGRAYNGSVIEVYLQCFFLKEEPH